MMNLAGNNAMKLTLTEFQAQARGIELFWDDGARSFFHYLWLRDCCYCELCGDSYSSKRYVLPGDIPLDLRPSQVEITDGGDLKIRWRHDDHESRYASDWLHRHRYDGATLEKRFHRPVLWRSSLLQNLPTVSFTAARDDDEQRLSLCAKLRDYGFVRVCDGIAERDAIESVANLIGDMGESAYTRIFDLSTASPVKTMGNTLNAVPPHTDEAFRHNPPGINILSCVRPASDGGDTVLVDGFQIAEQLRQANPGGFELLCRHGQSFNRLHEGRLDQRARQPMISLDDRGEIVAVRIHTRAAGPLAVPSDRFEAYYAAYQQLSNLMMNPDNQIRFRMAAGDSVLFDNSRVLHSRTEFGDASRFLQICNVSRDEFHETFRLLASRLGRVDESDLILA